MKSWKPASGAFVGGTQQVLSLKGTRVRVKTPMLSAALHDAIGHTQHTAPLAAGSIGFIANPFRDDILIAFAKNPGPKANSLDALMRSGLFQVFRINCASFRQQFEIES